MDALTIKQKLAHAKIHCYGDNPAEKRGIVSLVKLYSAIALTLAAAQVIGDSSNMMISGARIATGVIQKMSPTPSVDRSIIKASDRSSILAQSIDPELGVDERAIQSFVEIASKIESIKTTVYRDSGGENIGIGYCITKQLANKGRAGVVGDLRSAGISDATIHNILGSRAQQKKVVITTAQSIALLKVVAPDYVKICKQWLTPEVFDKLTPEQQAVPLWMTYNSGTNVKSFKKFKHAVSHHQDISQHVAPSFKVKDAGGIHWVKNDRAGSILATAWKSSTKSPSRSPTISI